MALIKKDGSAAIPSQGASPLHLPTSDSADGAASSGLSLDASDIEVVARALDAHDDYKVIRRFQPRFQYANLSECKQTRRLLVVDCESTGLDLVADKIVELGLLLCEFDPETGRIGEVLDRYNGLEDPKMPMSEGAKRVTGLKDEDLVDQSFDNGRVVALAQAADLVLAHSAAFDRPMIEKRYPVFQKNWWACSLTQAPWAEWGFTSAKLDYLLVMHLQKFHAAHRALEDCEALAALLASEAPDGRPVFKSIADQCRRRHYHLWATGAPFEHKDALKKNGYGWCGDPRQGELKAWHKLLTPDALQAEFEWLTEHGLTGGNTFQIDCLSGRNMFSTRFDCRLPVPTRSFDEAMEALASVIERPTPAAKPTSSPSMG